MIFVLKFNLLKYHIIMTTRNLNSFLYNWNVSALKITANSAQNLSFDASGSSNNIFINSNNSNKIVIGSNVDPNNNTNTINCCLTVGTIDSSTNTSINAYGSYFSDGVSALRLPQGSTSSRPNGLAGYIRYNTTNNQIEYYNNSSLSWVSVNSVTPTFISIVPSYVSQDFSQNYTITGSNFNSTSSVSFIGVNDNITYTPLYGTVYNSTTSLSAVNSTTMSGATGNTGGFYIKITNTNSGTFVQPVSAQLTFNQGPAWVSPASNASVGTGFSSTVYDASSSPFSALVATDSDTPITYIFDPSGGAPSGASSVTMNSSNGKLIGTMPASASTFNFIARAKDNLNALSLPRTFSFTTITPQITVNSVNYNISSPQTFSTQGYYTLTVNTNMTLKCQLWGAGGGGAGGNSFSTPQSDPSLNWGAAGGYVEGYIPLTSGTTYVFLVGQGGLITNYGPFGIDQVGANAFPDGGASRGQQGYGAAGGGGSTRFGPFTQSGFNLTNSAANYNNTNAVYYLIAGAGSGLTDYTLSWQGTLQGYGGYPTGGAGACYYGGDVGREALQACGGAGTQSAGGAAGNPGTGAGTVGNYGNYARLNVPPNAAGTKYQGGNGSGGGGGGGYYGGGGSAGYYAQAGGGSSYYNPSFVTNFNSLNASGGGTWYVSPNTGLASNRPGNAGVGGKGGTPTGQTNGNDGAIIFTLIN